MNTLTNLYDLSFDDLTQLLAQLGEPNFRARQIWQWLYQQHAADVSEMTNLSKSLRDELAAAVTTHPFTLVTTQHSSDGQTQKALFLLPDGNYIETVLMQYNKRRTLCISTQAGCAMGCVFCATGQMGFFRTSRLGKLWRRCYTLPANWPRSVSA